MEWQCFQCSSHRMDPDVPILLPEVNPDHTALVNIQRKKT
jgi:aspartate-semialdehyde dehydrogenase